MATFQNKLKKYLEANSKTWDAEFNNFIIQNDSDGNLLLSYEFDVIESL